MSIMRKYSVANTKGIASDQRGEKSKSLTEPARKSKKTSISPQYLDNVSAKLEEQLLGQSELMLRIQELAKMGLWELDISERVFYWTDEVYKIHQVKKHDKVGFNQAIGFCHPDFRGQMRLVIENAQEHCEPFDIELKLQGEKNKWVRFSGQPKLKDGSVVSITGFYLEIESSKAKEESYKDEISHLKRELEIASRQLKNADQELNTFLYSVSHDLRAPMRAVEGFSGILSEDYAGQIGTQGTEVIETITKNTSRMKEILENLLVFSRISRQDILKVNINSQYLISSVLDKIRQTIDLSRFKITISDDLPVVFGDSKLMYEALYNLIENAIKFSSTKHQPIIHIDSIACDSQQVHLYIRDNGVGFNMDYYEKLFKVMQRLHRHDEFEGAGIGLAITHNIVNRHGGKIWAESEIDFGSEFHMTLPLK